MKANPPRPARAIAALFIVASLVAAACRAQVPTSGEIWFSPVDAIDGYVKIHPASDGDVCLELEGAWFTNHDRAQLFRCYGSNGFVPGTVQQWLLLPAGRGPTGTLRWRLANREFSKCLDTAPVRSSVSAQPCNGTAGQQWEFVHNDAPPAVTRQFSLRALGSGLVLERTGASDGSGLRLTAFANSSVQAWQAASFVGSSPDMSSPNYRHRYRIELQSAPGKVLDVRGASTGDNIEILAYDWWGGNNQKFAFFQARDPTQYPTSIEAGFYSVFAQHSDKAMEVYGFSRAPGGQVEQWTWFGFLNQAWVVLPARDAQFVHLINGHSGLALQPAGGSITNGTSMTQAHFDGSVRQSFRLIPVP